MGQVWTAYDKRLDRRVAVKLLRPDKVAGQEADELRRRFVRECRVTAQVDHPGLVTVHDAGSEGEELFLVMQYIDGADLGDHLAEHDPYPWQWTAAVAAQLCAVLSAVHAVPIVHRALKPRNRMDKQDGPTTVLDLGVLMHELLSGDVPFAGSTALGVLHRHLYEPPVPVRRLRPEVPEALESLVLRLLSKDPQHRPASAQEVYEHLALLLPSRGTPTGSPLDPTRPLLPPPAPWPDRPRPPAPHAPPPPPPAPARALARPRPHPRTAARPRHTPRARRGEGRRRRRRRRGQTPPRRGPHHPGRRHPRRHPARRRRTARRALPGRPHPAQAVRGHPPRRRPVPPRPARTAPPRRGTRRRAGPGRPPAPAPPLRGSTVPRTARRTRRRPRGVPVAARLLREQVRLRRPAARPRRPPPHRTPPARPRRPRRRPQHTDAAAARRGTRAGPGTPDGRRGPADPAMAGTSARIADAGRGGPSRGRAAVPEVPVNRWSNGLARAWPMPTIDHRKT